MRLPGARPIVHRLLTRVRGGRIVLVEDGAVRAFGEPAPDGLTACVAVHDARFHRAVLGGSRGLSEGYADGLWDVDDLVALIRIAARNMHRFDRLRRALRPVTAPLQLALGTIRRNTTRRSRRQIAAHYDVGNDLYELFLDETMTYSAAVFETPDASLDDAQRAKLDRVCRKLALCPGERLLEIGSGWGGLALHAAERYGVHVTTTTISCEQHAHVTARVAQAGLGDRVTVLLEDYRALRGSYDKLVSIEMIEAVGWRDFATFFRVCSERLAAGGTMLLQAITIDDRAYDVEKATRTFIKTVMFPGGCLPSVEVLAHSVARSTDMRIVQLEDLSAHYATTLQRWRARFRAAADELARRGYDARFQRRWDFYLAYCEAGFAERRIQDVQLLLAKPGFLAEPLWRLPEPAYDDTADGVALPAGVGA